MEVLVIGAGLMGAQIGCEYALGGHRVALLARQPAGAEERSRAALDLVEREGLAAAGVVEAARSRVRVVASLDAGLPCDLAVESVPEQLALKAELLGNVARACPDAILASNTSSLSVTALGEAAGAPGRTIGTHYWNPPLLMPLVELVAGERSEDAVIERMRAVLLELGKRPVVVRRDVPGFLWNRLQFALLREMLWLVENGVASSDEVDEVLTHGLARRYRHVGLFQAIALGGVGTWQAVGKALVAELSTAQGIGDLRGVVPAPESLAEVARRRDHALAVELRAERG